MHQRPQHRPVLGNLPLHRQQLQASSQSHLCAHSSRSWLSVDNEEQCKHATKLG